MSPKFSYYTNPIAELEEEIGRVEQEIMRTERHLLKLYRTAFESRLSPISPIDDVKQEQRRLSLADHLGAAALDANRVSEDILRCIASIYCEFGAFSGTGSPMAVHVIDVRLNDGRAFDCAAASLQRLRALVRSLESVDPRKMKKEGKIAFWINIHNALLMHAYLAYGMGNRASAFKAVYNIGGHGVNAQIIQSAILRIRSRNSSPWLQTLLPGKSVRHEYALDCPEPLVHFALSSGDLSDPPVRVYTAKKILGELRVAKEDFIKENVEILHSHKETKVLMPRLLYYFAKDASVEMKNKLIQWLPQSSKFGYVIHPYLANNLSPRSNVDL